MPLSRWSKSFSAPSHKTMKHSLASTPAKPNKKSEVCKRYPQDTLCNITKINLEKNK